MTPPNNVPCWEIMKCRNPKECEAFKKPDKQCWEIAKEREDYRSTFSICKDCIVYLIKEENKTIPDEELESIIENRTDCVLASIDSMN